jgi:hypothetical protein
MSALPVYQLPIGEQQNPQVIYLVVPQAAVTAPAIQPYSLVERLSLTFYNFQIRSRRQSDKVHAIAFAISFTILTGFWAYNVKSAFGIDIFPHQHLENFIPLPGWQR